tara:strand:- start:5183 stop:5407 length:225 start_codon:yes stop_codon:yes gene_type:complete
MDIYYKIDKNVPMPEAKSAKSKYDFVNNMEVGDSFVVGSRSNANAIQGYCNRTYKIKLAQRSMGNSEWRLWRVE